MYICIHRDRMMSYHIHPARSIGTKLGTYSASSTVGIFHQRALESSNCTPFTILCTVGGQTELSQNYSVPLIILVLGIG